jgi:hypothetical protein
MQLDSRIMAVVKACLMWNTTALEGTTTALFSAGVHAVVVLQPAVDEFCDDLPACVPSVNALFRCLPLGPKLANKVTSEYLQAIVAKARRGACEL